jgi:hypothetical protein
MRTKKSAKSMSSRAQHGDKIFLLGKGGGRQHIASFDASGRWKLTDVAVQWPTAVSECNRRVLNLIGKFRNGRITSTEFDDEDDIKVSDITLTPIHIVEWGLCTAYIFKQLSKRGTRYVAYLDSAATVAPGAQSNVPPSGHAPHSCSDLRVETIFSGIQEFIDRHYPNKVDELIAEHGRFVAERRSEVENHRRQITRLERTIESYERSIRRLEQKKQKFFDDMKAEFESKFGVGA